MKGNLVLLGYMGSGKSTIGRAYASMRGLKFIDLDDYIEEKEGMNIAQIFQNRGVIHFRKVEKHYLNEILEHHNDLVLAVGGGTPCYYDNMTFINAHARSIYLQMGVKALTDRLWVEKEHRPLIASVNNLEELQEFIGKHLFERNPFYQQAQHNLVVNDLSKDQVISQLQLLLS